jgi:hypothetical protein
MGDGMLKLDYNRHVIDVFWRLILFPVTLVRWGCRTVFGWCSTSDSRRAKDTIRQSRARRVLRGLTPDHDPAANRR